MILTLCFLEEVAVWVTFSTLFPFALFGGRPRLFGGPTGSGLGAEERPSQKLGEDGGDGECVKSVKGLDGGVLIEEAMMLKWVCGC